MRVNECYMQIATPTMNTIILFVSSSLFFNVIVCYDPDLIKRFLVSKETTQAFIVVRKNSSLSIVKSLSDHRFVIGIVDDDAFAKLTIDQLKISSIGIILDTDCNDSTSILQEASNRNMFESRYKWLIITRNDVDLTALRIGIDSDVTIATYRNTSVFITEIYKINQDLIKKYVGNTFKRSAINTRIDFNGAEIRIAVVILKRIKGSMIKYLLDQDLTWDSMVKDMYSIILLLASLYNFRIKLYRVTSWGVAVNGSYNGLLGMLQRREIDIGGSAVYFKSERLSIYDTIAETRYQKIVLMFRHPHTSGNLLGVFLAPLEINAWICAVICIVVISATMIFTIYVHRKPVIKASVQFYSEIILYVIGAVCQQGLYGAYNRTSIQISSMTILLFSVMLYQFYSASIVSTLLKDPPKTIKTPQLFLDSNLHMKVEDFYYHHVFFKTSTSDVIKNIYAKKVMNGQENNFVPTNIGVELVRRGNIGFLLDVDNGYTQIADTYNAMEICDLCEILLAPIHRNVAVARKEFPYRKLLTIGYRKLFESGIAKKEANRWHPKTPKCIKELIHKEFAVNIGHVSSAFIILTFGMLLSILLLIIEYYLDRVMRKSDTLVQKM